MTNRRRDSNTRVMGIDPGLRITGYGVVDIVESRIDPPSSRAASSASIHPATCPHVSVNSTTS